MLRASRTRAPASMSAPLRILARDTLRTLLRRRANAILLVFLFCLLIAVSCSLKVTGGSVVGGQVVPIDEEARLGLAIGTAFGGAHFIGFLTILFVVLPALAGEIESGLASWILVRPVSRSRFLLGRALGAFAFAVLPVAIVALGLEVLLARHLGRIPWGPIAGALALALLFAVYLSWGLFLALRVGGGSAAILVVLCALASIAVHADVLTRWFLLGGSESPSFVGMLLTRFFGWETPPAALRFAYGAVYALLPATANLHDLAVAASLSKGLALGLDYASCALAVASIPVALHLARRSLERRDL